MSKELEAFLEKRIIDINNYLKINKRNENEKNFPPVYELQICKLAKRMLDIDNAKPSEALECLENFINECQTEMYNYAELQNGYQYEKYQYRKRKS